MDIKKASEEQTAKTSEIMLAFPWHDPEAYAMWLAQTYYMVNYSTRLVAFAGALASIDEEYLHCRFIDHAREERGHPQLCLRDLKALGTSIENYEELCPSAAMYQIQYYWIQHVNPSSFFGYVLGLEQLGAKLGPQLYEMTSSAHGPKAASFLKVHSDADVEHVDKALTEINKLNDSQKKHVLRNLELSCHFYRTILLEIQEKTNRNLRSA